MTRKAKAWRRFAAITAIVAAALFAPISSKAAGSAEAKMPTVKLGDNIVKLEVAASEQEIERGLMYRTSLPEDHGMIFLFHPPRKVNFWMYHTLISLDMLFIKNGTIVKIFHDVPPCKSENQADCPLYPGGDGLEVTEVIELKAGYAKRHNVTEGEAVQWELK